MSCDQRIDQSVTSIQSMLNTNGATFLMTSHVRLALWTLQRILKSFAHQVLVTFFLYFDLKQNLCFKNNVGHLWFPLRK